MIRFTNKVEEREWRLHGTNKVMTSIDLAVNWATMLHNMFHNELDKWGCHRLVFPLNKQINTTMQPHRVHKSHGRLWVCAHYAV